MNSFNRNFARAATASMLALSTMLSSAPAMSIEEEPGAVELTQAPLQQKHQVTFNYKGPDSVEGLQEEINRLSNGTPVFVMFHATWCPSCRQLSTEFEQAKTQTPLYYRVLRVPVSVGADPETAQTPYLNLAKAYKIQTVPDTTVFLNGQSIFKFPAEERTPSLATLVQNMTDLHQQLVESARQQQGAPAPRR